MEEQKKETAPASSPESDFFARQLAERQNDIPESNKEIWMKLGRHALIAVGLSIAILLLIPSSREVILALLAALSGPGTAPSTVSWQTYRWWYELCNGITQLTGISLANASGEIVRAMSAALLPAVGLTGVAGAAFLMRPRPRRLSYLEIRPIGLLAAPAGNLLSLANHDPREDIYARSPDKKVVYWFIPWEFIKKVTVTRSSLWWRRDDHIITFQTNEGVRFSITWLDVLACSEPGALLNAFKTWAPDAISGEELRALPIGESKPRYTRLWLASLDKSHVRQRSRSLENGQSLKEGKYKILGVIGSGGQGTAYLAATGVDSGQKTDVPAEVVLKEYILPVHKGRTMVDKTTAQLEREAGFLRRIDHPQVVKLLDCFVEDYRGYVVMEFVDGTPIRDLVIRQGPQPEKYVATIACQICNILEYLHSLDPPVIHRDITPENLIVDSEGKVNLIDFTVAHQFEANATATVVGKHAYLPPEQFRGRPVRESDIYALGGTMFYLLTGQDPEPITVSRPAAIRQGISGDMDSIVARTTALKPEDRYGSATELHAALALLAD